MTREVLTLEYEGLTLVGTRHAPAGARAGDVGVLILNAGPAPRAGNSDLSAHACDRLGARGFEAVRIDLPGLGDSMGASELDIEAYWRGVLSGRNDAPTLFIVRALREKLGLRALVVGGLCAGSVTAIRVADADPTGFAGLLLLEPEFRVPAVARPRGPANGTNGVGTSAPASVPASTAPEAPSGFARNMRKVLHKLGVNAFPPDANLPLIRAWVAMLEHGLPSFAAVAEGLQSDHYVKLISQQATPKERALITRAPVPGTNHILTSGDARRVTIDALEQWMIATFVAAPRAVKSASAH